MPRPKRPRLDECATIDGAARIVGTNPQTLRSAIKRGELTPCQDASERDYLIVAEVQAWAAREKDPKKGGRPLGSRKG